MPARASHDHQVWDTNTACEVLLVPRRGAIDPRQFLNDASSITDIARNMEYEGAAMFLASDGENDVVAATWNKDILSPAGVFSLHLKHRTYDYRELIAPGDLLLIFMDDAKDYSTDELFTGRLITIGIVDRVTTIEHTTGEGADTTMTTVTGRDFGAIFTETSTVHDPSFAQFEQQLFSQSYVAQLYDKQVVAQSPVENVLTILNLYFNEAATGSQLVGAQWALRGHVDRETGTVSAVPMVSLLDITTFVQRPMFGYPLLDSISPAQAGNVWTLMDTYANRVVNELFIDVRDYTQAERDFLVYQNDAAAAWVTQDDASKQRAFVDGLKTGGVFRAAASEALRPSDGVARSEPVLSLVYRQTPYDTNAFQRLPQVDVYPGEVFETELGYAAHDAVNYFRVRSPVLPTEYQELVFGIRVNVNSVFKFGLRRIEPETMYFFLTSQGAESYDAGTSGADAFAEVFNFYVGLLSTWYATNETMLAGSITMRLRPDLRVGQRLRLHMKSGARVERSDAGDVDAYDFYVQALSHNVAVEPGGSRTTVQVVRGVRPGGASLESNLYWERSGPAIPPELDPYIITSATGLASTAASATLTFVDSAAITDITAPVNTTEDE